MAWGMLGVTVWRAVRGIISKREETQRLPCLSATDKKLGALRRFRAHRNGVHLLMVSDARREAGGLLAYARRRVGKKGHCTAVRRKDLLLAWGIDGGLFPPP